MISYAYGYLPLLLSMVGASIRNSMYNTEDLRRGVGGVKVGESSVLHCGNGGDGKTTAILKKVTR